MTDQSFGIPVAGLKGSYSSVLPLLWKTVEYILKSLCIPQSPKSKKNTLLLMTVNALLK